MEKSPDVSRKMTVMKAGLACLLTASCLLSTFASGSPIDIGSGDPTPPANARPMTGAELYMLYRDKSWPWPDGAGRLQTDGRRFTAWSGSGDKASWAVGRWTVSDQGRLCFKAQWHTVSGAYPNTTCFIHKKLGNIVYQKRQPSGDWYVFKHAEPADDEFSKLADRDLVSNNLERIKADLQPAPPIHSNMRTKP
ncbi:DUF995 domain-containing protein [Mesorhizobium qingshengii]|uniref:DUF995 domain-containing protein n=1 Tax=Mesorhizobium qingshengii TaxID=1165689 RepID=A0ABT4R3S9_9HYPH|nr:DUF995 domain-containing protein [Mesorhizobium qingshengii]MCZ8548493.1 DUF995 domain-containing protein [Mesorhizobium qingshengii]